MALHVGVVQVYLTCDQPDDAHTTIRLVIKKGGRGLHLLANKNVSSRRYVTEGGTEASGKHTQ